ncbi:hypothetical protein [Paractinoplanes atraurantiacus]|uniref:hypothetical protein n=1 Tax=Paractinoplanes atraurantiacus TaxID=1036182 RepID=UPI001178A730|nr:hypothetical protein [Actinoplanes atraurantiacus]
MAGVQGGSRSGRLVDPPGRFGPVSRVTGSGGGPGQVTDRVPGDGAVAVEGPQRVPGVAEPSLTQRHQAAGPAVDGRDQRRRGRRGRDGGGGGAGRGRGAGGPGRGQREAGAGQRPQARQTELGCEPGGADSARLGVGEPAANHTAHRLLGQQGDAIGHRARACVQGFSDQVPALPGQLGSVLGLGRPRAVGQLIGDVVAGRLGPQAFARRSHAIGESGQPVGGSGRAGAGQRVAGRLRGGVGRLEPGPLGEQQLGRGQSQPRTYGRGRPRRSGGADQGVRLGVAARLPGQFGCAGEPAGAVGRAR